MALIVDIEKNLGDFHLDVDFELSRSDRMLALLGPSGCGKSVTLGCIAGMIKPDAGRIELDGTTLFDSERGINLPPQKRRVGYLFQQYALFPNMTVEQNIAVGLDGTKAEKAERVAAFVKSMRLEGLEKHKPAQLSGGQQQRCALARMLAPEPHLVLLDEPFSALDGFLRWELELELTDTLKRFGGGAIYVTHNRDEVYRMCDDVIVVDKGRSDAAVPVQEFFDRPRTRAAAVISGCKNISRAVRAGERSLACEDWGVTLETSEPVDPDTAFCGLRAHLFEFGGDVNAIPCTVSRVIDDLFTTIVMLDTPGGAQLRIELDKSAWAAHAATPGDALAVSIAPGHVMPLKA